MLRTASRRSRRPRRIYSFLCANAVAKASGVDSAKILPISSSKIDSKTYQVELDAGGKKTSCLVDTDGAVKFVEPI